MPPPWKCSSEYSLFYRWVHVPHRSQQRQFLMHHYKILHEDISRICTRIWSDLHEDRGSDTSAAEYHFLALGFYQFSQKRCHMAKLPWCYKLSKTRLEGVRKGDTKFQHLLSHPCEKGTEMAGWFKNSWDEDVSKKIDLKKWWVIAATLEAYNKSTYVHWCPKHHLSGST